MTVTWSASPLPLQPALATANELASTSSEHIKTA